MEVLRLVNVTKDYLANGASVPALRGVSLSAQSGELIALVGRSGCGKSTLLNLAGAMDSPTTGQVFVNGLLTNTLDDPGLTRLRREAVGFIFQSFQLLPTLSVYENVELPLLLANRTPPRSLILDKLRWVEMDTLANRLPYQLSGGQQQRVAIARALVHSPQLLLADEPIGNLDSTTGELVLQLLRRIAAELGTTILMATHSRESTAIADTIVTMRDGCIEALHHPTVST